MSVIYSKSVDDATPEAKNIKWAKVLFIQVELGALALRQKIHPSKLKHTAACKNSTSTLSVMKIKSWHYICRFTTMPSVTNVSLETLIIPAINLSLSQARFGHIIWSLMVQPDNAFKLKQLCPPSHVSHAFLLLPISAAAAQPELLKFKIQTRNRQLCSSERRNSKPAELFDSGQRMCDSRLAQERFLKPEMRINKEVRLLNVNACLYGSLPTDKCFTFLTSYKLAINNSY